MTDIPKKCARKGCGKEMKLDSVLVCDLDCGTVYCGACMQAHFNSGITHDAKCKGKGKKMPDPMSPCGKCKKQFKADTLKYNIESALYYCSSCIKSVPTKVVIKPVSSDAIASGKADDLLLNNFFKNNGDL